MKAASLLTWYRINKRDLPWRHTMDPYKIWLSEVILQQTRVDQGLPYYERFIKKFPDVFSLAVADEEAILKTWQGLGYYSRARNLHKTAKQIAGQYQGIFPGSYNELQKLQGIGPYTAAAIASFAYDEKIPVVDGNVYRVIARYFGITRATNSSGARKEFSEVCATLIEDVKPSEFNQAIMEFGALHCTPRLPSCASCPFSQGCHALTNNRIAQLPVKKKKKVPRKRYFNYFHLISGNSTYLVKRDAKDIWTNLYEFPLLESSSPLDWDNLIHEPGLPYSAPKIEIVNTTDIVHPLSHQRIHARFWKVKAEEISFTRNDIFEVNHADIQKFAIPRLIDKYLESLDHVCE